ncbi:MAG: hypothetical protein ACKVP4_03285 [Hyphomicrobium sp.]
MRSALKSFAFALVIFAALAAPGRSEERLGPPIPGSFELIDLVRATVLAVDAGNKSGDYTRLFEMGTPTFQAATSPERLAAGFEPLRSRTRDLSVVKAMTPQTTGAPTVDRNGLLRILGFFEIGAVQLVYDLVYDYDHQERRWRVAAISLIPHDIAPQPELMQPR